MNIFKKNYVKLSFINQIILLYLLFLYFLCKNAKEFLYNNIIFQFFINLL